MSLLEVRNVSKHFGSLVAVQGVSLNVEKGELRAIIGPNGAGKTTFFNMISGFFPPTKGDIVFDGETVTQTPCDRCVSHAAWRAPSRSPRSSRSLRCARTCASRRKSADGFRLHMWVSRAETARVMREVDELLAQVGSDGKADRLVGELSHGDQRAAEIAMALALRPRLLLLDEPTAGMGEQETYQVAGLIRRLHRNSAYTIVLIEHDMRVVFNLADRITVLAEGTHAGGRHAAGDRRGPARAGGLSGEGRMNALEAQGLNTFYGKSHILHDVGLTVAEGSITTLLGRNGAGKTTTLRSLVGLTPPRAGACACSARTPPACRTFRIAALGVGYVPEGRRIFRQPDSRREPSRADRAARSVDDPAHLPAVPAPGRTQAESRSAAFRRRAGDAVDRPRLLLNPRLLILDEPSQGLAPLIVREVFRIVAQMRGEGISVLLVEQNVRVALEIADDAYVLENGQIVYSGNAAELGADEERIQALAGASAEEWQLDEVLPT